MARDVIIHQVNDWSVLNSKDEVWTKVDLSAPEVNFGIHRFQGKLWSSGYVRVGRLYDKNGHYLQSGGKEHIIIRDNESRKPVAVIDAKYKPNTRSARSDTHQLLSYVLLTDVKQCGFAFPGSKSRAKIMDATETTSLPLAVDSLNYYELILGNDLDNASEALQQILP